MGVATAQGRMSPGRKGGQQGFIIGHTEEFRPHKGNGEPQKGLEQPVLVPEEAGRLFRQNSGQAQRWGGANTPNYAVSGTGVSFCVNGEAGHI